MEVIIYIIASILSLLGLILTLLSMPGIWLIYISTILVASLNHFDVITLKILVILFFVSLFSTFIDNIINALGVKIAGGTKWGILGAVLGGLISLIFGNILIVILAPLIGAFLFEYLFSKSDLKKSLKAGLGAFLGVFLTGLLKMGINISVIMYVLTRLLRN